MSMQKTVAFTTLGCKVNQYDTQAMLERFLQAGYAVAKDTDKADVYVVNTCTVTETGDKKSLQLARRYKRKNPHAELILAGCLAQRRGETLKDTGARLIIGTQHRNEVVDLLEKAIDENNQIVAVNTLKHSPYEDLYITHHQGHTRAVMKIQEGCNHKCTYCIIPSVRGDIRSRSLEDVKMESQKLGEAGFQEIVLTGIHLSSYGKEFKDKIDLIDAVKATCEAENIQRVRLGSLEPNAVNDRFIEGLKDCPKVCQQFHLALQSGCDSVLKRMRRAYNTTQFLNAVKRVKEAFPKASFTTDLIVGFPGETEEEFQETLDFIKQIGFFQIHIFPYSQREDTPAASMLGQCSKQEKQSRVKRAMQVAEMLSVEYRERNIGEIVSVLLEEEAEDGIRVGYTDTYVPVFMQAGRIGQVVQAKLIALKDSGMIGELVE